MGTIKTITTVLLLLFTVTAFSQTKEETLEWLNQNSGYCYVRYVSIDTTIDINFTFYKDYFIRHRRYYGGLKNSNSDKIYYKDIFLREILQLDVENGSNTNPPITSILIPVNKYYSKGEGDYSYKEEDDDSRFYFRYETDQPNARKNLEKVLRAIMHMAKLHGAEPYKDLFGE